MSEDQINLSALSPEQRERWQARLDKLPAGLRETLRKNLERVPPDRVAQILNENEPMLRRLQAKAEDTAGKVSVFKPMAHSDAPKFGTRSFYNNTIQRGDGGGLPLIPIIGLAAAIALGVTWLSRLLFG